MLDCCFWYPDVAAGCIAHTLHDVKKMFRTKVKYPYDNLPPEIRDLNPAKNDTANELIFQNGSSIFVGSSLRSSTLQILHISEYAKVCAKYPDKAAEIQSGALNTVHEGAQVFIEGTAEGRGNDFHTRSQKAEKLQQSGAKLTKLDYKFFFFPWWRDAKNVLDAEIVFTEDEEKYFKELKNEHGIELTQQQKNWYVKKAEDQEDLMYREHPSTPTEAFWASQSGSIYGQVMTKIRKNNQILARIPLIPTLPVETGWDLGKNDETAIWFFQKGPEGYRMLHYFEDAGQGLDYYWRYLVEYREKTDCFYGNHYMPHDVEVSDLSAAGQTTRRELLEEMGMRNIIAVPRVDNIRDGISATRSFLSQCWFSEYGTEKGIAHLENYRYELDMRTGSLKDTPFHGPESNGADAIRQIAQGYADYNAKHNKPRRKVSTAAV